MNKCFRGLVLISAIILSDTISIAQTTKTESVVIETKKRMPASVIFGQPEKTMVTISPDGNYLAYLAPFKETLNLFVEPVNGGTPVRLSLQAGNPVEAYQWATNEHICFQAASSDFTSRAVYAAHIHTPESAWMISDESMDARLLRMNAFSRGGFHFMQKVLRKEGYSLCQYDFETNLRNTLASGEGTGIYEYFVGFDGNRIVALANIGVSNQLLLIESASGMKKVFEFPAAKTFVPVALDTENKTCILAISNINRKNTALVSLDFYTGKENRVVFEKSGFDVLRTHNNLGSVSVLEMELMAEKIQVKALNSNYETVRAEISEKLDAKSSFVLDCADQKGNNFIIHTTGSRYAPDYYRYNLPNKELKLISNTSRDLIPNYLSEITVAKYVNRDGKEVEASIVLPHSGSIQAPVIIYLPESPDKNILPEYNPEIQFLVNNGFVVWIFDYAGNGQYYEKLMSGETEGWAQLVERDIIDAAKHLIKLGTAHPDKVTILAQGLAGPLAINAMAAEPKVFSCGVFLNAVFDYSGFLNGNTIMVRDSHPFVGLLKQNDQLMNRGSLLHGKIQVQQPMLFIYSNYDECFASSQSNDAAVASARLGNTPEIFAVEDAHELYRTENKVMVWDQTVEFIKRRVDYNALKAKESDASNPDKQKLLERQKNQ